MNISIPFIPERTKKTRQTGLTMMMDKGLSVKEVENFIESNSDFTDLVKFGFGTSLITKNLEQKIKLYKQANIRPYFGGTLFEMFLVRGLVDDFKRMVEKYKLDLLEVSDGSIALPHEEKLKYISELSKQATVLSEVGSKQAGVIIPDDQWVAMMKTELQAGAWKVIAEARESGNIGIYNTDGSANTRLIDDIINHVNNDNVLWEAPNKNQQVWFIKLLGSNVNLGNIATNEVFSLETLRLGLRGDTFFQFLPEDIKQKFINQ
jgi:phosphosulfolactate synthase